MLLAEVRAHEQWRGWGFIQLKLLNNIGRRKTLVQDRWRDSDESAGRLPIYLLQLMHFCQKFNYLKFSRYAIHLKEGKNVNDDESFSRCF